MELIDFIARNSKDPHEAYVRLISTDKYENFEFVRRVKGNDDESSKFFNAVNGWVPFAIISEE